MSVQLKKGGKPPRKRRLHPSAQKFKGKSTASLAGPWVRLSQDQLTHQAGKGFKDKGRSTLPSNARLLCPEPNCRYGSTNQLQPFTEFTALKQHYNRVHGFKKFACKFCAKFFALTKDVTYHEKTCRGSKDRDQPVLPVSASVLTITTEGFLAAASPQSLKHVVLLSPVALGTPTDARRQPTMVTAQALTKNNAGPSLGSLRRIFGPSENSTGVDDESSLSSSGEPNKCTRKLTRILPKGGRIPASSFRRYGGSLRPIMPRQTEDDWNSDCRRQEAIGNVAAGDLPKVTGVDAGCQTDAPKRRRRRKRATASVQVQCSSTSRDLLQDPPSIAAIMPHPSRHDRCDSFSDCSNCLSFTGCLLSPPSAGSSSGPRSLMPAQFGAPLGDVPIRRHEISSMSVAVNNTQLVHAGTYCVPNMEDASVMANLTDSCSRSHCTYTPTECQQHAPIHFRSQVTSGTHASSLMSFSEDRWTNTPEIPNPLMLDTSQTMSRGVGDMHCAGFYMGASSGTDPFVNMNLDMSTSAVVDTQHIETQTDYSSIMTPSFDIGALLHGDETGDLSVDGLMNMETQTLPSDGTCWTTQLEESHTQTPLFSLLDIACQTGTAPLPQFGANM